MKHKDDREANLRCVVEHGIEAVPSDELGASVEWACVEIDHLRVIEAELAGAKRHLSHAYADLLLANKRQEELKAERDEARAKVGTVSEAMTPFLCELADRGQTGVMATDAVALLVAARDAAAAEAERMRGLIRRLIATLPNETHNYSGVGRCAGCGALHYCTGRPNAKEPCKPECVLQEARKALAADGRAGR